MPHSKKWEDSVGRRRKFEELKKKMEVCAQYIPRPIYMLTDEDARLLAQRMADGAQRTLDMTRAETGIYAQAILDSILYFNERSQDHAEHMRFLSELITVDENMAIKDDSMIIVR